MTELISDGGQTWAVPAIADALFDMFKKDPNWSLFHDGGHERFSDGRTTTECALNAAHCGDSSGCICG